MSEPATVLHVCTTCRAGAGLHERLAFLLAGRPEAPVSAPVRLLGAKCLSNCEHGGSASIAGAGKWSYLLGNLDSSLARDLLDYAATYAASASGVVMPSKRPASLAGMVRGRIPPFPETFPA